MPRHASMGVEGAGRRGDDCGMALETWSCWLLAAAAFRVERHSADRASLPFFVLPACLRVSASAWLELRLLDGPAACVPGIR